MKIKKIFMIMFAILSSMIVVYSISFAQNNTRGDRWSDPLVIFETMVDDANDDGSYAIQETALDGINDQQWAFTPEYKISNTLDYIRKNLDPYLQWAIYAWLVLATIWLIYAWFLLVTNAIHKQGDWTKIKTKIMHILIGVFLLTWFYLIIKITVALITSIFGGANWSTGY